MAQLSKQKQIQLLVNRKREIKKQLNEIAFVGHDFFLTGLLGDKKFQTLVSILKEIKSKGTKEGSRYKNDDFILEGIKDILMQYCK